MTITVYRESVPVEIPAFFHGANQHPDQKIGYCADCEPEIRDALAAMLADGTGCIAVATDAAGAVQAAAAFDGDADTGIVEVTGMYAPGCAPEAFCAIAEALLRAGVEALGSMRYDFFPASQNARMLRFLGHAQAAFSGAHRTYAIEKAAWPGGECTLHVATRAEDVPAGFAALHDSIFPQTYYDGGAIVRCVSEARPLLWLPGKNGALEGYACCEREAGEANIEYIGIAPALRGGGRGRVLLEMAMAYLFGREDTRIRLCVSSGNAPARTLYTRVGFVQKDCFLHYTLRQ